MTEPVVFDIFADDPAEIVVDTDLDGVEVIVASAERGPTGPAGDPGPTGSTGPPGTEWWFGHGPPSVVIGAKPGDVYRDLDSGVEYRLD